MIKINNIETDIADHCNLSCKNCSHHSPYAVKGFYSIEDFKKDVNTVSKSVNCNWFKLLGGEPLLNKTFYEYSKILKDSNICDKVALFTNGILLGKYKKELYKDFDCIVVSRYPGSENYKKLILKNIDDLKNYVKIIHNYYDEFEEQEFLQKNDNKKLVQDIYDRCKLRYECNTIYKGYFFKCIASQRKGDFLKSNGIVDNKLFDKNTDGVNIHSKDFLSKFLKYYYSDKPLYACQYCTGSCGKDVPHESKKNKNIPYKIEDILSIDKLKEPPIKLLNNIQFLQPNIKTRSIDYQTIVDNDGILHIKE
jgi:organic radical activating enzyme